MRPLSTISAPLSQIRVFSRKKASLLIPAQKFSLTRCEIISKRGLLVLSLQKPIAAKALQMRSWSAFAKGGQRAIRAQSETSAIAEVALSFNFFVLKRCGSCVAD